MKQLTDLLRKNKIICKTLKEYPLKTKKKIKAFIGVNLKDEYCFILEVDRKTKILSKDIEFLKSLIPKNINFRYKKIILILKAPICSKAKKLVKEWRVLWY